MKKKQLRRLVKKIVSQILIIVLMTNSLLSFVPISYAQDSTGSAQIVTTPEPTSVLEPTTTISPLEVVTPTPVEELTATPSATTIPTPISTHTPTPIQSIETTLTPTPTTAITNESLSTMEALENFINESTSSGIIDYAIKPAFKGSYPVSLKFGETPDDPYLQKEYKSFGIVAHDGIDYDMPEGTEILAVDRGIVISAGPGIYGTTVVIYHPWGMTYYGHLSETKVVLGQIVETGEVIGLSGTTGLSTGPHLHFSIKPKNPDTENGYHGMVDPSIYFDLEPQTDILGATTVLPDKKTKFFKYSENAEFEINIKDKNLKYKLLDSAGKEVNFDKNIYKKNDKNLLTIYQPKNFRPGKYILEITNGFGETEKLEFYWGVLVVNTNKSIYKTGDTAYLQMASLSEYGNTLCNSNLELEITSPTGETTTPSIEKSDTCGNNNVTDNPDYFSYYQANNSGVYQIKLKNLDNDFEIIDSFEVKDYLPFDIERIGATRINPFASDYQMTIKFKTNQDFKGYIVEQKPDGFQIINSKFGWDVDMKAGEEKTLSYMYHALEVSPQIFYLGPIKLVTIDEQVIFEESRSWQLAADAALTATAVSSGTWGTASVWRSVGTGTVSTSGNTATLTGNGTAFTTELAVGDQLYESDCSSLLGGATPSRLVNSIESATSLTMSGKINSMSSRAYCASGIPHNIDNAVINSGVTVQVSSNRTINSVVINNPSTGNNGLTIDTGVTLTVTTSLTLNANSAANTESVTLNGTGGISTASIVVNAPSSSGSNNITCSSGTGTLSASGTITITGGSTGGQAGTSTIAGSTCTVSAAGITINGGSVTDAALTSSTGTITTTNGITFGGTQAQAKLTTTGAGTINLTGTLGSGGTLSINAGTTLISTGTSAINGAYTIGKLTVSSGTLTQGAAVVAAGDVTVTSTLAGSTYFFTAQANYTNNSTHSGSGGVTVSGASSVINGSGTVSNTGTFTVSGATPSINSAASITIQGKLLVSGAITLTNNGTLTLNTSANSLDGDNGSSTFVNAATGTLKLTGSIFSTNGVLTASASGNTVEYNGAAQTVKAVTYHHLTLSGSGTKTITNLSTVNGNFTLSGTAATTNAGTLAITGTLTATGTTFTNDGTLTVTAGLAGVGGTFVNSATGTLNYAGSTVDVATFTVSASGNTVKYNSTTGGQTVKATTYSNLTIDKTGQIATLGGNTVVGGDLLITVGTLDVDVSNNYSLSVAGDWTNNGTFEARAGEVTLNGAGGSEQIIIGANTFYDLVATAANARTLTFEASHIQAITHALNFSGSAGQVITLQSSATPTKWRINTTGIAAPTLDYLYVTDSQSTLCLQPTNSDGADNTNWDFIGTGCTATGPKVDQLMRHGTWFNNNAKQPFTF